MNSKINSNNLNTYLRALENSTNIQLVKACTAFHQAILSGSTENIRNAYKTVLSLIQSGEEKTGVRVMHSEDGNYLCAVTAFSALVYQAWQKKEEENKARTIQFPSVHLANEWLRKQTDITLLSVKVQTRTALGLFANHTEASNIIITYSCRKPATPCRYGMIEDEKTHVFFHDKCENYQERWEKANPKFKCLFIQGYNNSRQNASNPFRIGTDYIEHNKFFITFSMPLAEQA